MKKRNTLLFSSLFLLSMYMNGQNGFEWNLRFFPYNFYKLKEDVNSDFIVDTQDVLRIYELMQNGQEINQEADVNLDKVVDTQDVLRVYEYIQTGTSPTLIAPDPAIDVISHAMTLLEYYNIMSHTPDLILSFFAPTDNGLLTYIDPVSIGRDETQIWKFMMNPDPESVLFARIMAVVFKAEKQPDGSWLQTDSLDTIVGHSSTDQLFNRLKDIIQNCLVTEQIVSNKHFYQTISGNYIYVNENDGVEGNMTVAGGFQMDHKKPANVIKTGNMLNGTTYLVDQALSPSYNSVSDVLASHLKENGGDGEFSKFYELLQACGAIATEQSRVYLSSVSKNGNLIYVPENSFESIDYLLNSFHYTMYVPTNAAMNEAFAKGLPTVEMLKDAHNYDEHNETDSAAHIRKVMLDFIKYHIQEQSLFVGSQEGGRYASVKLSQNGAPYRLTVDTHGDNLKVQGVCSPAQLINTQKMYNQMACEYWLGGSIINTSSSVILHAIDHPLLYKYNEGADLTLPENNQFIYAPNTYHIISNY